MPKTTTWIASINSHAAKFFERTEAETSDPKLVLELAAELDSNHEKPGRTFNSVGSVRHGIEPHTDRRDVEKQKFAEQISKSLTNAEKENCFGKLILLASPKMLGILDKILDKKVQSKIISKSAINVTGLDAHGIRKYLERLT